MHIDHDRCLRAMRARDARFDGWFFTAVRTTGIYCRPSCPAITPKAANVEFHPSAASAQRAGFRACKRCRPDASPGSPEWDLRADTTARAVRLIADGVVDREGVAGLARQLGYSARQIERHLQAELGAGPLALARAHRAQTARILIETTSLPFGDIAFAAGFGSIRSFNDTVRTVFDVTPSELRGRSTCTTRSHGPAAGVVELRLPFRQPFTPDSLFGHLAATGVPGVEEWRDGAYRRTLRLPHGHAIVELRPRPDHVGCRLRLTDLRDLTAAVGRCRHLLDLDADPVAVDELLAGDPSLTDLVDQAPGRRIPRTVDAEEFAVRAVLGQQVSTAAARTHAARLVQTLGEPVEDPDGGLAHLFPSAEALAGVDPDTLAMPRSRRAALSGLVEAIAAGGLDLGPGADRDAARAALLALPGLGPWTVEVIAMRGLGDPDAFPATDLGVKLAAQQLGLPTTPAALLAHAARWRPWRAYAVQHLWGALDHDINVLPGTAPVEATDGTAA
ncbi:AlkA N-terminal domain-containing protein [Nitriliruptor alkaliphilus]|uniref:AlkA N-terminal domain-containing protein n=1 Tax=Nitriliruptor alkaliphilus TaxID=427918 RepID=UPI00069693CA|nr:AlkA N-terminal domain-containing protein [Nitriliruptor alkaliphilus]